MLSPQKERAEARRDLDTYRRCFTVPVVSRAFDGPEQEFYANLSNTPQDEISCDCNNYFSDTFIIRLVLRRMLRTYAQHAIVVETTTDKICTHITQRDDAFHRAA